MKRTPFLARSRNISTPRFEGAIRKARPLQDENAFHAYWEAAVENGFAPGAYWALVTHPRLPGAAEIRIFGDVHMMSHVCGASHRSDAREIAEARREKAEIARRLTNVITERNDEIRRHIAEIERLARLVRKLEPLAAEGERLRRLTQTDDREARLVTVEDEITRLREQNFSLLRKCVSLERQRERLKARLASYRTESPVLPPRVSQTSDQDDARLEACNAPRDLCGRCLLYVGGRPRTVCRLQQLVASRNGFLLHHDGGVERSRATLGELIKRADAVFFPVDCVSHLAADAIKSLCENQGIPYSPLRSASAAAFTKAIEAFGRQPEPNVAASS